MQKPASDNSAKVKPVDLEIKDAHLIFTSIWNGIEEEFGRENLRFPKEVFWLNGAPGAGKGTQTRFLIEFCDLPKKPLVISDLLSSPEARRLIDAGMMVGDGEVTEILFRRLLDPIHRKGTVVDGYPRTMVQAECLKLLYLKMNDLRNEFFKTELEADFPKPIFHIIVLYVDEIESIRRQLHRARQANEHNQRVKETGDGELIEVRATDLKEETTRNRYRTFKELTYNSLRSLREVFHYHYINAHGPIPEVQERIVAEMKYQSSLELDQPTYDRLQGIPIASRIVQHARQDLISRLDRYALHHGELLEQVVDLIKEKFIPIIIKHSISGMAIINSEDKIFENPLVLAMLLDVFSERGYKAVVDVRCDEIPDHVDPDTWKIITRRKRISRFRITFPGCDIRRGN